MVETEKVCSHKISTASTTSELVQRTKSVGDSNGGGGGRNNHHNVRDGGSDGGGGGGGGGRKGFGGKEDGSGGVQFARSNTIATGNSKVVMSNHTGGEGGKGSRPGLERSTSAYYVFSSLPQVVHNVRPKTGYRNNVSRPRGAHDYFNVMWDPHIYRGTTTTLSSSLKQPDAELNGSSNRDQQDRYRRRRAFLQGSQNTFNTSTNTSSLTPVGGVGGAGGHHTTTIRSNRYRMTTKVTARSRTFPPPEGRHQVHVQTEEYLEDLTRDVGGRGPEVDAIVQTDPIEDEELLSSPLVHHPNNLLGGDLAAGGKVLPVVAGVDASTQVLPGELVTFDERVQPVVEAVVGKILEQALLETMEEEEIGALKAQQNRFLEKRKEEERELKRLQEQQERISAEKERLKRHLEIQLKQRQNGGGGAGGDGVVEGEVTSDAALSLLSEQTAQAVEGGNGAVSTAYLMELLPSVLNSLRQEGFLLDEQSGDEVLSSYVPLWQQEQSSTSSKPDDETSPPGVTNNDDNDNNDGGDDDDAENGDGEVDEEDNYPTTPDGCKSRANSLELDGDNNPDNETFVEEQECEVTAETEPAEGEEEQVEEEAGEEEKGDNEEDNCDLEASGEEKEEVEEEPAEEAAAEEEEEITPEEEEAKEDTEEVEEKEEQVEEETEAVVIEGEDTPADREEETSGDDPASAETPQGEGEEEEKVEDEEAAEKEGEESEDVGGGESEAVDAEVVVEETVEEEGEKEENSDDTTVITPIAAEENEEGEGNNEEIGEEKEEAAEEDTGKVTEEDTAPVETTEGEEEESPPEAEPPTSSLSPPEESSSSQKLPNGAIPSVL